MAFTDAGLSPEGLKIVLEVVGNSPMAVALFLGLWMNARMLSAALTVVLQNKADVAIRAIVGLTVAIRNAAQPPPPPERPRTRESNRRKTDPQALR